MTDRWAVADLRATAIMDAARTGAVAERNGRVLAEAAGLTPAQPLKRHVGFGPKTEASAGLARHETTPEGPAPASTAAHPKADTPPAAAARVQTSPSGGTLPRAAGLATRREPEPSTRGQVDVSTPADGWLHRLMACPSWSGRRLDPEEELSLWVAAELRRLTRSGALRAVWTRCPVEVRRGGHLAAMWQCLGRVLGVVPGCPDFLVLWGAGAGGLELKVERAQGDMLSPGRRRTYLRQGQRDFREWCVSNGVRHEVCRSVPEVTDALRRWGRLL
jgi:hypothetical protein